MFFPYALSGRDFIAGLYHRALPCAVASAPLGPFAYWFRLLNGFLTLCWAVGFLAFLYHRALPCAIAYGPFGAYCLFIYQHLQLYPWQSPERA
jgi:hypothetical protein